MNRYLVTCRQGSQGVAAFFHQTKCHVQIRGAGEQSAAIYLVECQSPSRAWHMTGVGRSSVASFYQGQDQEGREVRHAIASQGWRLRRTRICGINMIFLTPPATMYTSKASHASQVCIPDLASRGPSQYACHKLRCRWVG
ncbi:uncharacterized protein B0T23DRAFT_181400 [Neurospora hispaniola]|uniref:Uncharacterized protein n=1 Tax=Neurospora hispaniola TaxID=588809 RepID=A0AAJ0I2R1_9PEZI|nr:hypothetical protein B0T23DRAFT_181400 [Neurospora hispaniola]